jgi:hypothetical protein
MQLTSLLAALAALGLAGACSASDNWDSKDPSTWSQETIGKLMRDSPWARAGKVSLESSRGVMSRGGQYPNGRNDPNQGNYPDDEGYPNGTGYPSGGNSRRSGVYLPGGIGLPFPGGGGTGLPGGRGGRGGNRREGPSTATAVVRWDSALPLRLAYALQDPEAHTDSTEVAKAPGWRKADEQSAETSSRSAKAANSDKATVSTSPSQTPADYIIAVEGFPLTSGSSHYSRQRRDSGSSRTGDQDDENSNSQYGGRDPEVIREELMERTTISRGSGRSLRPVKVEFDLPGKSGIVYFHFSREDEITLKDKELVFQTQLGGNRLERKFETKAMVYKGKLEL